MKTLEKTYPIDIFGIKRIGIEKWLDNYYMPVGGVEYERIEKDIFHAYLTTIKEYDEEIIYWIAVSYLKLPRVIADYIVNLLKPSRLEEEGFKYVIGKDGDKIPMDIACQGFAVTSRHSLIDSSVFNTTFTKRSKNLLGIIKCNAKTSGLINRRFIKSISSPSFFIGSKNQKEIVAYCNEKEISPIYLTSEVFASKNDVVKKSCQVVYREMREFVNDFLDRVNQKYPVVSNIYLESMKKKIDKNFKLSLDFFYQNIAVLQKIQPKTLLATGLGNKVNRLFCAAWRFSCGEVVGFLHGDSFCNYYGHYSVINDGPSVVNRFITSTRGQKNMLEATVKDFSLGLKMPQIECINHNYYNATFEQLQKGRRVNKIKKVMLIGNFMVDGHIDISNHYHAFVKLHLDLTIIKLLRSAGYYVIYKARPDFLSEIEGVFEAYVDEISKVRFEDVYDQADCIIFKRSKTTAFGFALFTNRPIVLLNIKGTPWYPRAFELLKKRCNIVEADYRDDRVVFDENKLLDAIETSPGNIEYDILHEFAF